MKTNFYILILSIIFSSVIISCQKVIDYDLETDSPRLVIDANIAWYKDAAGNTQTIKLTTTGDYYNTVVPTVSGATVKVSNSANQIFNFVETQNGEYVCTNFVPVIGETYSLTVTHNNQTYTATEQLIEVPYITSVTQETNELFGETRVSLKFFMQDTDANNYNYYLEKVIVPKTKAKEYSVFYDRFFQGNQIFGAYFDTYEDVIDSTVVYTVYGISEKYYQYAQKLLSVSGNSGGGSPFNTTGVTVRGNIINTTNEENYPLGYFSLTQADSVHYKVK